MKRAAVYARRSTDHQEESLGVQTESAAIYASTIGAEIEHAHIFVDKSVSRAEYKKRPGLYALLNAAAKSPKPFDILIMRDVDRLGGDTARNGVILSELLDRGIEVHEYLTKHIVKLTSATDRFMAMARNYAAEIEREKTAARTRENHQRKAEKGLVTGGMVYGYRNIRDEAGVHHEIDPGEAAVIVEIFTWYAAGWGLKRIARELNKRRLPSPQAGLRGTGSWGPSVLHSMIRRERYSGVVTWGRTQKGYRLGTKVRERRSIDDPDVVTVELPHLRIVSDDLWFAVQSRISGHAREGHPRRGRPARHLLSGIGRCAVCGGPMIVNSGKDGTRPIHVYQCGWAKQRGPEVCRNTLRRPLTSVHEAVIRWLTTEVLTPSFVFQVVGELRAEHQPTDPDSSRHVSELEREAQKIRREMDRLVSALAALDDKPDILIKRIAERQAALKEVETVDGRREAAKSEQADG